MTENQEPNSQDNPEYRDLDEPESTKEADERERAIREGDGGDAVNDPHQDDQEDDGGEGEHQPA